MTDTTNCYQPCNDCQTIALVDERGLCARCQRLADATALVGKLRDEARLCNEQKEALFRASLKGKGTFESPILIAHAGGQSVGFEQAANFLEIALSKEN